MESFWNELCPARDTTTHSSQNLFDHKVDPDELKNHIAQAENKDVAKELAGHLLRYAKVHLDSHITNNEKIRSQLISLTQ